MKNLLLPTTTLLNLLLLLLLLLLLAAPAPPTATADSNPVLDVYGDPLVAGKQYYIVPYNFNDGGGLKASPKWNFLAICPTYYVAKLEENLDYGTSISLYPNKQQSMNEIPLSYDLNIVFNSERPSDLPLWCFSPSFVWKLSTDDRVQLDGKKGNLNDVGSWFKIVEHEVDGYIIRYCPDRFVLGAVVCGNLGVVYDDSGKRWFGVNNTHPLPVMFEPAF